MVKVDTKEKLLQATMKLISEKGYLGATTREIAQEAGVTELTLFRHFGSKEKLFGQLLSGCTFLPRLKELLPELDALTYEEALTLIAVRYLTSLKERKAMVKIMFSEMTVYPEKIKAVYNKFIDEIRSTLATYFKTQQKKGSLRGVSPEAASRMFMAVLTSYFRTEEIMREHGMTKQKMEKDIREFVDIFVHGTLHHD